MRVREEVGREEKEETKVREVVRVESEGEGGGEG